MKKRLFTSLLFFFLFFSNAKAQYVTIPDTAMVSWLTIEYPSAMVGNQMDTTDASIVNEIYISVNYLFIENLDGIQYFDNASTLSATYLNIGLIPAFPPNLIEIYLNGNLLISLPPLPSGLQQLHCPDNILTSLPILPTSLSYLDCMNNNLINLPTLPSSINVIRCNDNNLTSLPTLPSSLAVLYCYYNDLAVLPELPINLIGLFISQNPNLSCLPFLPNSLFHIWIDSTSITCLPNYPPQLVTLDVSALPICQPNNLNGCITTNFISGAVFHDANNDCINSANLTTASTFHLYDDQNNFLQSRSSSFDDNYFFSIQPGEYSVRIDSSFFSNSVAISCPISGEHSVVALPDSSYADRDFGFQCAGIDVGVEAIVQQGIVFPGQPHSVKAFVGDLSSYVGLNCAAGTGGSVQLTVSGPVTFAGYPSTALAPSVSGNTFTYTISDFGMTNVGESFVLNFVTDTTAQSGDAVTVTATITTNTADTDSTNNFLSYAYNVVNSYDPNMKVVNPVYVLPGYDDYFTYTVHFQNLGSAPAFNIKVKDTLDSNLDFSTFRVINASHNYSYNLSGDLLTVYFPNIMLADSASNPEGSKGFVQYQVKPKVNMPLGTTIENTAHIFFDFNPAVVTNTTTNAFVNNLSVAEKPSQALSIYPNPSNGNITLVNQQKGNEAVAIQVFDLLGKALYTETVTFKNGIAHVNLDLNSGSYLLVAENQAGILSSYRLVVEK